ncbi:MAG: hypothetical protein ACLQVN_10940 [Bryobacteraceae bacterium]
MARFTAIHDTTTLQMALIGYRIERQKIDDKIREIQDQLKGGAVSAAPAGGEKAAEAPKRVLSLAARRRIAMAQKKRWAEHRRRKAKAAAK